MKCKKIIVACCLFLSIPSYSYAADINLGISSEDGVSICMEKCPSIECNEGLSAYAKEYFDNKIDQYKKELAKLGRFDEAYAALKACLAASQKLKDTEFKAALKASLGSILPSLSLPSLGDLVNYGCEEVYEFAEDRFWELADSLIDTIPYGDKLDFADVSTDYADKALDVVFDVSEEKFDKYFDIPDIPEIDLPGFN